MKRHMILFIILLCLFYCSGAFADAILTFEIEDDTIILAPEENGFNQTYRMEILFDITKVTNLSIEFDCSENIRMESVTCVKYQKTKRLSRIQEDSIDIIFTKQLENGLLNMQDVTFGKGYYLFLLKCSVLNRESPIAYIKNRVLSHDEKTSGNEFVEFSNNWSNTTLIYIEAQKAQTVSSITFANNSTARAGIPYELKANVVPESANIEWSVVDSGETGAIVTDKVLFTVAPGEVIVEARVKQGNVDGSDYVRQFVIHVEPVRNLSSSNKVIGINPYDFFGMNEDVRFRIISDDVPKEQTYGDFHYIAKGWSIDDRRWHFFRENPTFSLISVAKADENADITESSSAFKTNSLQTGLHTFHAAYTTMRFNGEKWVDSGYDYVLDIPFVVGAENPRTGDRENLLLWFGFLIAAVAGTLIIRKIITIVKYSN